MNPSWWVRERRNSRGDGVESIHFDRVELCLFLWMLTNLPADDLFSSAALSGEVLIAETPVIRFCNGLPTSFGVECNGSKPVVVAAWT